MIKQDLEKRDAVAEKKRESIMVNFNQTKGQLSSLENALKTVQVDLEKTQFALEVKKGAQDMPHIRITNTSSQQRRPRLL